MGCWDSGCPKKMFYDIHIHMYKLPSVCTYTKTLFVLDILVVMKGCVSLSLEIMC